MTAKFHRAEQMLKRLPFAAPLHEIAQRRKLRFGQVAFEFQVQLDPFPSQHMGEQMLGIQARTLDRVFREIRRHRLNHFENGHVASYRQIRAS